MDEASVARSTTSRASDIVEDAAVGSDSTSQIINTLMYQCEVKDCHFEHVQVGGTTVCMAPYVAPEAAEIMTEIRRARQDYRLPPFKLPEKNSVFAGRDNELSQLATCFAQSDSDTNATEVVILGKGGVGKSQLAIAYAWSKVGCVEASCTSTADMGSYNYVVYLPGSSYFLSREIYLLARDIGFGFDEKEVSTETVARAVYRLLSHLPRVLFVIDGLDQRWEGAEELLPPRNISSFHCLYTSKERSIWETTLGMPYRKFELEVFSESGVLDYFYKSADDRLKAEANSETDWLALAGPDKHLGGLPLALAQAMAYLKKIKTSTIQQYLEQFNKRFAIFASHPPQDDYRYTVLTTWMMTLPKLLVLSPNATELFFAMAYLQGNTIPRGIIDGYYASREGWSELDVAGVSMDISHLADYSLINELDEENIQIHQLLQESIIWWLGRRNKEMRRAKSSSTPQRVVAHQAQLIMITEQIEQAEKQGCVTEPYQLICTFGEALRYYNKSLIQDKGILCALLDDALLVQATILIARLVCQQIFIDRVRAAAENNTSEPLERDDKLIALFLKLWIQASLCCNSSNPSKYSESVDKLIELGIKNIESYLQYPILIYLKRVSPMKPPSNTQWEIIEKWMAHIVSQRLVAPEQMDYWQNHFLRQVRAILSAPKKKKNDEIKKLVIVVAAFDREGKDMMGDTFLGARPFERYMSELYKEDEVALDSLSNRRVSEQYRELFHCKFLPSNKEQENPCFGFFLSLAEVAPAHSSEMGAQAIRMQVYRRGLLHKNIDFLEAHKQVTFAMTLMSEISEDLLPSDSALGSYDSDIQSMYPPTTPSEVFGENYAVYQHAEENSRDWKSLERAGEMSFRMGFYEVAGHYFQAAMGKLHGEVQASTRVKRGLQMLYLAGERLESRYIFCLAMVGASDKAKSRLLQGKQSNIIQTEYSIFFACCLVGNGDTEAAVPWFVRALTQPTFPIAFNNVAAPMGDSVFWITSYLMKVEGGAINWHYPHVILSSHQLAVLQMIYGYYRVGDMAGTVKYFDKLLDILLLQPELPEVTRTISEYYSPEENCANIMRLGFVLEVVQQLSEIICLDDLFDRLKTVNARKNLFNSVIKSFLSVKLCGQPIARLDLFLSAVMAGSRSIAEEMLAKKEGEIINTILSAITMPEKAELQLEAAEIYHMLPSLQNAAIAAQFYERAIGVGDSSMAKSCYHNLACCYEVCGDNDKAENNFRKAIEHVNSDGAYVEYAHFLYQQGHYHQALECLGELRHATQHSELSYGSLESATCEVGVRAFIDEYEDGDFVYFVPQTLAYYLIARCHEQLCDEASRQLALHYLNEEASTHESRSHAEVSMARLLCELAKCNSSSLTMALIAQPSGVSHTVESINVGRHDAIIAPPPESRNNGSGADSSPAALKSGETEACDDTSELQPADNQPNVPKLPL